MSPPIISSRRLMITSPSPVPSTVLLRSISSRSNLVKSLSISSFLIPIPVSETLTLSNKYPSSFLSPLTLNPTEPCSVYFTALTKRFVMICLTRTSSPISSSGRVSSTSTTKSSFLSKAFNWTILQRSLIMELTS